MVWNIPSFTNTGKYFRRFFTEGLSTENITFRLSKLGDSLTLQARLAHPSSNRDDISNGTVYTLPYGEWGGWVNISSTFNSSQSVHTFMVSRNVPTGGNNLLPTYRITVFFNGNNENVRVIVEAWYHL